MTTMPRVQTWWRWGIAGLLAIGLVSVGLAKVMSKAEGREVTLRGGLTIVAALEHTVSTERNSVGDAVELRTVEPIALADGAIPEGATIQGEITHVKGGGRIAGAPELTLRFTRLELDGKDYAITAAPFRVKGTSDAQESAKQIGGGAVAGGVLGAVLGGKGGVLKGAAVGAVLGTGVAVATDGDELTLPAGQRLRVQLAAPVTVRVKTLASSVRG